MTTGRINQVTVLSEELSRPLTETQRSVTHCLRHDDSSHTTVHVSATGACRM